MHTFFSSSSGRLLMLLTGVLLLAATGKAAAAAQCDMRISRPELELGRLVAADVNPRGLHQGTLSLSRQSISLNVMCDAPTSVGIRFRASPASDMAYAMNGGPGSPSIKLTLTNSKADGKPVTWASSVDSTRNGATLPLAAGDVARATMGGMPQPVTQLTIQVDTEIMIDAAYVKSSSDRDLSGTGMFELVTF